MNNTYDYDIYKVMTIACASKYNNQRVNVYKYYEYDKQTKKIIKLKSISKTILKFFNNNPLLNDAFDNNKITYISNL